MEREDDGAGLPRSDLPCGSGCTGGVLCNNERTTNQILKKRCLVIPQQIKQTRDSVEGK